MQTYIWGGFPLSLKIFGVLLCGKDKSYWESYLDRLIEAHVYRHKKNYFPMKYKRAFFKSVLTFPIFL